MGKKKNRWKRRNATAEMIRQEKKARNAERKRLKQERKLIEAEMDQEAAIDQREKREDENPVIEWSQEFKDAIRMLRFSHPEVIQPKLGDVAKDLGAFIAPFVRDQREPTDAEIMAEINRLIA